MLIAVLAAIAAGACFASAGLLQQRAASALDSDESLSPRLLADLARRPMWLAGIGLAVGSYGFQALALAFGPLSMVQPLIVLEVVFALPLSARLHHLRMKARDWGGAVAVAGGLALALVAAAPSSGEPEAPFSAWVILLGVVAAVVVAALLIGRRGHGPVRATMFALAGGSVMGTQSGLFAVTIRNLEHGFVPLFTSWQTYLLIVASIGGLWLIQSAYNSGPLAASMPVIDAVEPSLAILIGLLLFGEHLAGGLLRHIGAVLGLLVALGGIVLLDTSPITRRMHKQDTEQGGEPADDRQGERDTTEAGEASMQ